MDHQAFAQLLGNYGEFVGAIAVVATLGYLAVQIRQNTRSNSISRGDTARQRIMDINEQVVSNNELAQLVAQCRSPDLRDLTPADEERVERFAQLYLAAFAGIERAYQDSELSRQQFDTFCDEFRRVVLTYPALMKRMQNIVQHFGPTGPGYVVYKPLFE
jgi:CRP-like cAMP-binding protein